MVQQRGPHHRGRRPPGQRALQQLHRGGHRHPGRVPEAGGPGPGAAPPESAPPEPTLPDEPPPHRVGIGGERHEPRHGGPGHAQRGGRAPQVLGELADRGIDLTTVTPTGPDGTITREDVHAAAAPAPAA
ncbi:E3 binding domain-containing protein, partial [Streptomyces sparsogenes]|uniref:E3 binding domain-containing protein n=1 Tax=Streptomyces sparsogenes TaxID=67365 RepID=UPI003D9F9456